MQTRIVLHSLPPDRKAQIQARSYAMYAAGYRVRIIDNDKYEVRTPCGEFYTLNTAWHTCTCRSFQFAQYIGITGRVTCKHLIGLRVLLINEQDAYDKAALAATDVEAKDFLFLTACGIGHAAARELSRRQAAQFDPAIIAQALPESREVAA